MRRSAFWMAGMGLITLASGAMAQAGLPNTMSMTCAQAQALVRQHGAIVLATGPNLYDRYVMTRNLCSPDQVLQPTWVQSADNPQCYIYNRCVDASFPQR